MEAPRERDQTDLLGALKLTQRARQGRVGTWKLT
jgi:hypothetical protein